MYAGNVTLENLTIQNMSAVGGAGGGGDTGSGLGGGGGAGWGVVCSLLVPATGSEAPVSP